MTDYRDISDFCARRDPALIYIAIGCAQGHNRPDHTSPQQFPPFIRAPEGWPTGEVIAVLIDPALEPDSELQGLIDADGDPDVAFIALRQEFHWDDAGLIADLCEMLTHTHHNTQLIIQDYTGDEIAGHLLPFLQRFGPGLLGRALFDVTYGQAGGCYVDFSIVNILRDTETGDFIQPLYLRLVSGIAAGVPTEHLRRIATGRIHTLRQYCHRALCCLRGGDDSRPAWLSDAAVQEKLSLIAFVYGVPLSAITPDRLTALLTHFLQDLATIADATVPIAELIASDEIGATMYLLRDVSLGNP